MMIPIHSTVIPIYTMVGNLKLNNSLEILSLIYGAFRIPVSIFILEGFMTSIPKELEECAVIDGCSTANIFFKVIHPFVFGIENTYLVSEIMYVYKRSLSSATPCNQNFI